MVMSRGLVGASHRIVIRYPIRRRVCTARPHRDRRMPHGGGAQLGGARASLEHALDAPHGTRARRHQSSHGSDALRTALSTETGDASRDDAAFVSGSLSFFVAMNSPASRHVRVP